MSDARDGGEAKRPRTPSRALKIVSFGEILWDIINDQAHIGGAPFNLAAHLARMGAVSMLVSAVGRDRLGADAVIQAARAGIATDFIRLDPDLPTGSVRVELNADGVPDFTIRENVAWDAIALRDDQIDVLAREPVDAFCFGTLTQRGGRNREILAHLLDQMRPALVFYDVNLRQRYYAAEWITRSLAASSIVKCNDEEARVLARLLFREDLDQADFAKKVCEAFPVTIVCITRGAAGAAVYHDGIFREIPGTPVKVVDTVGAGDAFSAGFLHAVLSGREIEPAACFAARMGAFVGSQAGAVPEYPQEIRAAIDRI